MATATATAGTEAAAALHDEDICYICMAGSEAGPLCSPCACPRAVHAGCAASWQLHRAGTSEETACRFCGQRLPDWRSVLAANAGGADNAAPVVPLVAVIIDGVELTMRVHPTEQGIAAFQRRIEAITGAPLCDHASVNFFCRHPLHGDSLRLDGVQSLAAAIHLAAVTAAQRAHVVHPQALAPPSSGSSAGGVDGSGSSSSSSGSDGGSSSGGSAGSHDGWRVQRRLAKAASALLTRAAQCCRVPSLGR